MSASLPAPPAPATTPPRNPRPQRITRAAVAYTIAIGLALAATVLTKSLPAFTARAVFFFHLTAIIVVSWYAGRRAGLVCTLASGFLVQTFIMQPTISPTIGDPVDLFRLVAFLALGGLTALLSGGLRDAMRRADQQALELQDQAMELEQQIEQSQSVTTQLASANEDLAVSERRYRALFEATTRMVWSTDANGMVEDMPVWRELTGQSLEQVRGQGWLDALHPDDRQGVAKHWRHALEARAPYESEYRLRMRDGSYRWFRARGVPVLDEQGSVVEWVGTFNDVHERRRAAELRAEEEALVATVQRIAGTVAGELEMERLVQTVTDAATTATGASFGAFFYNIVDAQGEKLTLYTLSGAPREAFEDFGHPRATPVFAPTFYGTAIVRSDDITADPRYGKLAPHHGMPKGHLPVRSYLAVPVVSRSGEVLGGLFFGHVEPGRFTERHERIVTALAGWAALAMDNAQLYEAERSARREAEAASRAKSDFLAVMSHELRTPLNAIGGYAQLLAMGLRGPVSDAQAADLERIERSQRHLLSLINDILNLARIEAGEVAYEIAPVDVGEALADIQPLVAPLVEAKGQSLRVEPPARPTLVRADADKMQQIILNLLSNAIKFTESGGEIAITCEPSDSQVSIVVSDTGEGIPEDRQEEVFAPFVQLDSSLTRRRDGTGLGLAISRDLALGMDGSLTVESTPGVGSSFRLVLPRVRSGS
ncbi:MAG TPA: ATP-binding protein [Gemmatimonadaceae bacterium]|nr:ATP-binding protein [Gemmatimonadaceae bacterium]